MPVPPTKPLTKAEKAWIARAQKLFASAPARLDFYTIGDRWLGVIDAESARHSEICDGAAKRDGILLDYINTRGLVHGVSG